MWGFKRCFSKRREERWFSLHMPHQTKVQGVRIWPFVTLIIGINLILCFRLAQLTLVEGSWRRQIADDNRIFELRLAPQRGIITDRNGIPLTQNIPAYKRRQPGTKPAELQYEHIERDQALHLIANPEESIWFDVERHYPCGRACAPAVGYLAEMSATTLFEQSEYQLGDVVGKVGAEKEFERVLKGIPGTEYLEVNAQGQPLRSVGVTPAQSGTDVALSIDSELTKLLYQAFGENSGAAVALDPTTGEVLAAVSVPSFDPNQLATALTEPNQPFFNRPFGGLYPPGSTFKLVTALSALEESKITKTSEFQDTGEIRVGDYSFGNWLYEEHGRTEGAVDVIRALARSNDIFFYHVGGLVGPDKLAEWANFLGIGKTWGLQNWGEVASLVPTPAWKQEKRGERWYLGNTYHMSIGQGDVLATPASIAVMTAAVANNGILCPPHFDKSTGDIVNCQQLNLNAETVTIIKEGMVQACSPGGTAHPFFSFSPQVGCKTGTAQQGGDEDLPHAWFTIYAPAEQPKIVISLIVEKAGQGSDVAAPIAKQAIDYWLNR